MKYKFHVDKKIVEVEIANSATFHSPTEIKIDKNKLEILIGEVRDDEVLSFFVDNKLHQVEFVRDENGYPQGIYVDEEFYSASLLKIDRLFYYKEKPVSASKSGVVKSFIPGYIKKIYFRAAGPGRGKRHRPHPRGHEDGERDPRPQDRA